MSRNCFYETEIKRASLLEDSAAIAVLAVKAKPPSAVAPQELREPCPLRAAMAFGLQVLLVSEAAQRPLSRTKRTCRQ
jgi:hypothetical protein